MIEVKVKDEALRHAAAEGIDAFVKVFVTALHEAIGGELTAENMGELNNDQITLLGFEQLHDEVMDGGFVQLIHNGWGAFIFRNPFDKMVRQWGMPELCSLIRKGHKLYFAHHEAIEKDCTDEEFMALFEQYPEFDELDDAFVESEEQFVAQVAHYIDEHIDNFAKIV